jgi:hypothetical protein
LDRDNSGALSNIDQESAISCVGFGHSHIVAIAHGCYALMEREEKFDDRLLEARFFYFDGEELSPPIVEGALNPNLLKKIAEQNAQCVLLSVGGNEHCALSIVQLQERFDFILGAEPDLPLEPEATVLPEAVVRETLREAMAEVIDTLRAFREATDLPLAQIQPPPPLPGSQVLANPGEFLHRIVDAGRLSSDWLRYKMWRVQDGLYRETCARLGVFYAPVPAEFITGDGMLAPLVWGKDATHANSLFGERMAREALSLVLARPNSSV